MLLFCKKKRKKESRSQKTVGSAFFCDKLILLWAESKHKADLGHLRSSHLRPRWQTATSGGNKSDEIWWDKYYDEVKEPVNQDVLAGCGHLSLWAVRGAGWGNMLGRHFPYFSREFPLILKEAFRRGTSTSGVYVVIVWICLAQRMPHIQLWVVRKWRFGRFHWRPCEVRLPAQRMTSFNEVRIHNPFACHVLVHIINIKPSSTPLSLISPGLDVHTVSAPPPPPSLLPSSTPWLDVILSLRYFLPVVCALFHLHEESWCGISFLALLPVHTAVNSLAMLVVLDYSLAMFSFLI